SASRFGFIFLSFFHQRADLSTRCVALCIEFVRLANHTAPLFICAREIIQRCYIRAPRLERRAHLIDIFSDVIKVQHLCQYRPQKAQKAHKAQNEMRTVNRLFVPYVPFVLFVAYFCASLWLISKRHLGRPERSHSSWTGALTI